MNMFKPTVFQFEHLLLSLHLDQFQQDKITKTLPKGSSIKIILLTKLIVSRDGILLLNEYFELLFEDFCWQKFIKIKCRKPYLFESKQGVDCEDILNQYEIWTNQENSKVAVDKLKHSEITITDIVINRPELITIEPLKSYVSRVAKLSGNKKGKRAKYSSDEYQLYLYACHYYVHDKSSYEVACAKAIDKHPKLISTSWKSPEETLRTRITTKYDNHPELSNKNYKKNRKYM